MFAINPPSAYEEDNDDMSESQSEELGIQPKRPSSTTSTVQSDKTIVPLDNLDTDALSLYTAKSPSEFSWRQLSSGSSTEGHTVYIVTPKSEFIFFQIAHSDLKWNPTAQVSARYYLPNRINKFVSFNVSAQKMKVSSPDRLSAIVETSEFTAKLIALTEDGNPNGNITKWNIFLDSAEMCFDLECVPVNGFMISDGKVKFGKKETDVLAMEFQPTCLATGFVEIAVDNDADEETRRIEINGTALISNIYQGLKPHKHADQWYLSYFVSDSVILFMIQLKTPAGFGRFVLNQGCVVVDGQIVGVSVKNSILVEDEVKCRESNYYIPKEIIYQWKGQLLPGTLPVSSSFQDDFYARINVKPKQSIATMNILEFLPWVLRVFVTTFIAKPYCFQWLDDATVEMRLGEEERVIRGKLFHELTIINHFQ